jgi:competence protein ComFC
MHNLNLAEMLLNFVFPPYCACCSKNGRLLCQQCYRLIHFNAQPANSDLFSQEFLDQALSLAVYQPPISDLIKSLKYQRVKKIGAVLAELIHNHLNLPRCDLITWAPISKKRLNDRGFNQAQMIGESLGKIMKVESASALKKIKHTSKQAKSSFAQRLANLQDTFEVDAKYRFKLNNKTVIIVDDVLSTGSTLNECARVLKMAGAKKVVGVAVARS